MCHHVKRAFWGFFAILNHIILPGQQYDTRKGTKRELYWQLKTIYHFGREVPHLERGGCSVLSSCDELKPNPDPASSSAPEKEVDRHTKMYAKQVMNTITITITATLWLVMGRWCGLRLLAVLNTL